MTTTLQGRHLPIGEGTAARMPANGKPPVPGIGGLFGTKTETPMRLCCGCRQTVTESDLKWVRDPGLPLYQPLFVQRCSTCRAPKPAEPPQAPPARIASLRASECHAPFQRLGERPACLALSPEPPTEPDDKWVKVADKLAPLQIVNVDWFPGLNAIAYFTDYDVQAALVEKILPTGRVILASSGKSDVEAARARREQIAARMSLKAVA